MGIELDNYTVREAAMQVETFLSNDVLNTIESISMQTLIEADSDPVVRSVISSLDLAVIVDREIMQAAGAETVQRRQETTENDFAGEFFKRVERNKKSVYLLGETEHRLSDMKREFETAFPKLVFAGEYALENCVGNLETVINEMNATTPDIIVSILPTPLQEHFFAEHKDKMNATVWYGMGEYGIRGRKHGIGSFFKNQMYLGRLKNSIKKYQDLMDGETEKEDEAH